MNRPFRLMLVGEDQHLSKFLKSYLQKHGYAASEASSRRNIPATIDRRRPDLIILDHAERPDGSEAFYQDLRASYEGPLLMLTEREDGSHPAQVPVMADAYVSKPIEPQTLLVRIRTLLKRFHGERICRSAHTKHDTPVLDFGDLHINRPSRRVQYRAQNIHLSSTEFDLLNLLAGHAGEVLDRDTINRRLRGIPYDGIDRSVDVAVSRLRKKLGDDVAPPSRIKTVWGQGYLFVPDAWD